MIDCQDNFATCKLKNTEKFAAIKEVIDTCKVFKELPSDVDFYSIVERREKIETTGIGHGIAIAHGKIPHLDRIRVGLGISTEGVEYEASDDKPVYVLFVIASSPTRQMEYLRTLANILRLVRSEEVRQQLLEIGYTPNEKDRCNKLTQMLSSQHFSILRTVTAQCK